MHFKYLIISPHFGVYDQTANNNFNLIYLFNAEYYFFK